MFNPQKISHEYGTNILFKKDNICSRIQYRSTVKYAGLFKDKYPIVHLDKHDIFINCQELSDYPYILAYECCKAFYPLVIICNLNGQISGIRTDIIKERWKTIKNEIEQKFTGKSLTYYLNQTERNIQNDYSIFELIRRDLFFFSYFNLDYDERKKEIIHEFPAKAFEKPFHGKSHQTIKDFKGKTLIEYNGIMNNCSNQENLRNNKINEGEYSIKYTLNNDSVIDAIKLDYKLYEKDTELPIMETQLQTYCLRESTIQTISDIDTINIGKKSLTISPSKHKGFFSLFNIGKS